MDSGQTGTCRQIVTWPAVYGCVAAKRAAGGPLGWLLRVSRRKVCVPSWPCGHVTSQTLQAKGFAIEKSHGQWPCDFSHSWKSLTEDGSLEGQPDIRWQFLALPERT